MEPWNILLLAVFGFFAGTCNVLAGGGSLLTMPAMMLFFGMDPATANGTNRVALVAQNVAAVSTFRKKGFADFRTSLTLAACTVPGSVAGAFAAVWISPLWFKRILAAVMLGTLFVILRGGKPSPEEASGRRRRVVLTHVGMVGVGFYGGFIQAGVGFLIMALLSGCLALDLVRVNMHKVFIVLGYTVVALAVFASQLELLWWTGAALALGNSIGGWLGAHSSVTHGETLIRRVLFITLSVFVVKLLFF